MHTITAKDGTEIYDQCGHGRPSRPASGNDVDGYAGDLAAVIEALDRHDATLAGHSTRAGEVARYVGQHATCRAAEAAPLAAVPPLMPRPTPPPRDDRSRCSTGCASA